MANDPNRDLLPVREESNGKCSSIDRFDHQILAKLPRCELEDKILRLLDEQTNLKKLVNCQEEKIKRLGTKLLRLIGEKKNGKKNLDPSKETEELTMRITELEHENYALRDKNVVLKQQLANHSRHITTHRSPVRSLHTSPLVSVRQPAPPVQTELLFDASNKNVSSESQLREAESHIKDLNEEIKALHCKIDFLQQNMERSSLDSRKSKVTENIELIRLQRSLKQQAIQIAALQAQVKNSENNQKILKEQLVKAHNENDEALHLISVKQNEILNLCNKLEENNLNRLEEGELRQRINDLMLERDCLKERSDFLMKSIGVKSEETARINELKKLLAEEKFKKQQLEEALENMQKQLLSIKNENKESRSPPRVKSAGPSTKETPVCQCMGSSSPKNRSRSLESEKKEVSSLEMKDKIQASFAECITPFCSTVTLLTPEFENDSKLSGTSTDAKVQDEDKILSDVTEGKYFADKLNLEREVQYLREMLRSQTCRCEAQQAEIKRLMYELKVNEEKCSETLRKLDDHLKVFQDFQVKNQEHKATLADDGGVDVNNLAEEIVVEKMSPKEEITGERKISEKSEDLESVESLKKTQNSPLASNVNLKQNVINTQKTVTLQVEPTKPAQPEPKKRFIDQVFLESSDEDGEGEKTFERESVIKKLGDIDSEKEDLGKSVSDEPDFYWRRKKAPSSKTSENRRSQSESSSESDIKSPSIVNTKELEKKPDDKYLSKPINLSRGEGLAASRFVEIGILWLKIDPESSVGQDDNIKLIFVDFSFLNVNGEETETPDSVQKPSKPDEKCHFNFWKIIDIDDSRKKSLQGMLNKPNLDLIVFKVVSEPEDNNMDFDCEDIGVATVKVKQFLDHCAKGPFLIPVDKISDTEVIGTLAVSLDASPEIFNYRQ